MKLAPAASRNALSNARLALALAFTMLLPLLLYGSAASWWSQRSVLVENTAPDDYAPVNQGQLKNIVRAAVEEMDAKLTGGAGNDLHHLIGGWLLPAPLQNDFAPVNLGQLKDVARPFYDRLIAVGVIDTYPWLRSLNIADDFAVANIGQVKNLFNFEIPAANSLDDLLGNRLAAGQRAGNLALEPNAVWFWGNRFGPDSSFQSTFPRRLTELAGIRSVSAGDDHLVALANNRTVFTWGKNSSGQLGDGTNVERNTPVALPNLANITSVKAGGAHTLALQEDGSVLAWGDNYYGQLGTGDNAASSSPVQVVGLTNVRKIAAGPSRSAALKTDGTVWTWGYDHYAGQDISNNAPTQVADITDGIDVAAGYEHVVAVKADGTVWAWGSNYSNQIGNGASIGAFIASPVQVPNLTGVAKVASTFDHSLALLSDGTVWAWGYNGFGQLGDGTTQRRQRPVQVNGLTDVITIATNWSYSMATKSDGTVWAWGDGASGTVPGSDPHVPQPVGLGLFDANHNGMDDRWELQFLGNLDQSPDADIDGDGVSNRQEYLRGTDPRDYFNGAPPVIEIVSGNNQIGNPGTFLSKPFKVRLRNQVGQLLINAPVTYAVSGGAGALAQTSNGSPRQSILLRTDINGEAAVYHVLSDAPGTRTHTIVTAGDLASSASTTFRAVTRFSLPPTPTPPLDPNASPTPTPSPIATPAAPYRYAIIDLGKDLHPIRITNQGTILVQGVDANNNWGNFRWKGGVLERLNYAGATSEVVASDINDAGTVVGSVYNEGRWVMNAENELGYGLVWPANTASATKISGPSAYPSFKPQLPGTLRLAQLTAINNDSVMLGVALTGTARGFLDQIIQVINSERWSTSGAPTQLSQASATNDSPDSYIFTWQGTTDLITRANSRGDYIGRKITPCATCSVSLLGAETGMFNGQAVSFNPVDINEAGIVVGSAGVDLVVGSSPTSQTTISGASPLAINDHTRPAPSSPASEPSPTPIAIPQILSWAGNALVLWELQADGQTWHPFGLEEMIPSMDGWDYLNPYDMNDNGAIVGTGWYTDPSNPQAKGELHAFLLVPVELMVDGNRDGKMSFDDDLIREPDRTSSETPYRFWLNNDHDEERAVDTNDREQDDYAAGPDFDSPAVLCERDLEDWSRLSISFKGIVGLIKSPGVTVELAWKPGNGGTGWATADGSPGIKVMLHDSQAGAGASDAQYLLEKNAATIQAHGVWSGVIKPVSRIAACVLPIDFLQFVTEEKPYLYLLFEGWMPGKGQLVINIKKEGQKIGEYPAVSLDLKDVKDMYERYSVGDVQEADTSALSPLDYAHWPSDRPTLMSWPSGQPFSPPAGETRSYVLWVHGWNMSTFDKDSYGDTAFKRLFWQGYKGRFGTFRWPTFFFSSDVPPVHHFDASEHRAWASSLGLLALLNELNAGPFSGSVRILAHSLGNVVASEALRRSNSGPIVHTYVASQAALSAHFYDVNSVEMQYHSGLGPTTPNVYGYYWQNDATSQPHQWQGEGRPSYMHSDYMRGKAGRYFNYYNDSDWALNGFHWQLDQQTKPDADYGYEYAGFGASRGFWRDRGLGATWLTFPTDRHEIFAWAAEPRSYALGAQWVAGVVGRNVDLKEAPIGYDREHKYHSGQFRGMNMERRYYWEKLLIDCGLKEVQ